MGRERLPDPSAGVRPPPRSHGDGRVRRRLFRALGRDVVFERGAMVFHPETIEIGHGVYVGHYAILKGYHKGWMRIGDGTWIGSSSFFHSAGGLTIGRSVGIGPGVTILTSQHRLGGGGVRVPVIALPIEFAPVVLEDGCDVGAGSIILPGVRVGAGAVVGAGSVVTKDVAPGTIVAGVPARRLRKRP